jgi:hypothetical protein
MTDYVAPSLDSILARCDEFGDCLRWTGPMCNGSPQVFTGRKNGNRYIQARRVVHEHSAGKAIRSDCRPIMKCRDPKCLKFDHMVLLNLKQIGALAAKEGKFSSPQRRAAITAGRRASAPKLDMQKAREIFHSEESGPVLAERYDIHRSLVCRIKRGLAWATGTANSSVFNMVA